MSAIRVERYDADHFGRDISGFAQSGYNSNVGTFESAGSVSGHAGNASFWVHGAYRQGSDYNAGAGFGSGDDTSIESDFTTGEIRGRIGYHLRSGGKVEVTGGYNRQDDIDFPGRLLNASFFDAKDVAGSFRKFDNEGVLRGVDANLYWNGVKHAMNNDGKPTRQAGTFPNGNPRPPLIITVDAATRNVGGRLALDLAAANDIMFKVGGDFYSANRDANRPFFAVMPDGSRVVPPFYDSDQIWPDVTISDIGMFGNASRSMGETSLSGTIRLDVVSAGAGQPSDAYLAAVGADSPSDLDASETNVSGAVTLSHRLESDWTVAAGLGSVVRTADALERYSDRVPASKSQTSAEFLGNPDLKPERSTQADLWLDGAIGRAGVGLSVYARRMTDYITVEPTNVPKLLPLSPDVVYRYVNGEATFYGAEGSVSVPIVENFSASGSLGWIKGRDVTLDEPALGVAPWKLDTSLRYEWPRRRFFAEGTLHVVGEQNRVAETRGEQITKGYTTVDVRFGWSVIGNASILAGVNNLLDEAYVNHLNASNPFTGRRIPEPGRVLFTTLRVSF
jgi:iron complex outermembrane receptor protein